MKCPQCDTDNLPDSRFCRNCAATLSDIKGEAVSLTKTLKSPAQVLARGTIFADRYQVIELLGTGGMGSVYRVEDRKIHEDIALKLIKPEIAADTKTIDRFRNELKTARKIAHRNVCRMFDLGEAEDVHFITMEFVSGEDLKSLMGRVRRLDLGTVAAMAKQICEGLSEAHRLGVVHRDLKPSNIMIDKEGNARIMDFGIARSLTAEGLTGDGIMVGTPQYMSPEQVDGESPDHRSDIYSLGVMLYEMVTNQVPFQSESAVGLAMKHKTESPRDPRTINSQLPENFSRVILKCLEKEKDRRFQSADELITALSDVEREASGETAISSERGIEFPTGEGREYLKSVAVLPFKDMSPQQDQAYFCDGLAEELINAMTQIQDLKVAARSSSFSFKDKDIDVREIGQALRVGSVLEGSVQKAGSRLRITAQLINVADGYHLWSERFDRDQEDIFAIQDEISLAVVTKLKGDLREEEKAKVTKRHTRDNEAYNLYLKGRYLFNRRYQGDMIKAVDFYQRAIDKDPQYAIPYVGIADVFNILGQWAYIRPIEAYSKAKTFLQKAMEIDDSLSELYSSLAFMIFGYEWNFEAAERYLRRSIELNPKNVYAHGWYAEMLATLGRDDEALAEVRTAVACEPLFSLIHSLHGVVLSVIGEVEKGRELLHNAIAMDPDQPMPYLFLGMMYCGKPRVPEKAIEYLEKAVGFGLHFAYGWLGLAYAVSGKQTEALDVLARLDRIGKERYIPPVKKALMYLKPGLRHFRFMKKKYASPLLKALVYMGLNMLEETLDHLEDSYKERDYFLPAVVKLKHYYDLPWMDELTTHPRFKAIQEAVLSG